MKKAIRQFPMKPSGLFGSWSLLNTTHEEWMASLQLTTKHPRCMGIEIGSFLPGLQLTHPDTIKKVIKANPQKGFFYEARFIPWQGENGLLTIYGPKWRKHRKLMSPCLNGDFLKSYMDTFKSCTGLFVSGLKDDNFRDGAGARIQDGENIEFSIRTFVADTAIKCLFAKHERGQGRLSTKTISDTVNFMFNESMSEYTERPYYYIDFIFFLTAAGRKAKQQRNILIDYAKDMIQKRLKEKKSSVYHGDDRQNKDMLDILLDQDGNGLDMKDVTDEVNNVFLRP